MTVQKYAPLAASAGYLDASQPLPEAAELIARLGPPPQPPLTPSTVEPYRAQVEQLLTDGVEMMTILDRLSAIGYRGSYSSSRRFARTLEPTKTRAVVRVHTAPGEEAQVYALPDASKTWTSAHVSAAAAGSAVRARIASSVRMLIPRTASSLLAVSSATWTLLRSTSESGRIATDRVGIGRPSPDTSKVLVLAVAAIPCD